MCLLRPNCVAPAEPCTISIADRRILRRAAWAKAAGVIASSNGNAIVTPRPRRAVRREMCFLVRNSIAVSLLVVAFVGGRNGFRSAHLEGAAVDHAHHEGRE